jgi:hypothetical protein
VIEKRRGDRAISPYGLSDRRSEANLEGSPAVRFAGAAKIIEIGHDGVSACQRFDVCAIDPSRLAVGGEGRGSVAIQRIDTNEAMLATKRFEMFAVCDGVGAEDIDACQRDSVDASR